MDTTISLLKQISQGDVIFVVSGLVGMVSHYVKKYAKNQTTSSLIGWFGKDNLSGTLSAFSAFFVACLGALGSGVITPDMNVYAVIYAGLMTGFAVDSGFNGGSGKPPIPPFPHK